MAWFPDIAMRAIEQSSTPGPHCQRPTQDFLSAALQDFHRKAHTSPSKKWLEDTGRMPMIQKIQEMKPLRLNASMDALPGKFRREPLADYG
jgi:hypothetical protein